MKRIFSFILIFLLLFVSGCNKYVIHNVDGWETGKIINLQFADRVIVVEDYNFEAVVKSYYGVVAPAWNPLVKGNISECLIAALKGEIPGSAVIKKENLKDANPNAEIIRINPKEVSMKKNFSLTGFITNLTIEVLKNGNSVIISESADDKTFKDSLTKACEAVSVKVKRIIQE